MPNWCENNLKIYVDNSDFLEEIYNENKSDIELDFNCTSPVPEELNEKTNFQMSESEKTELINKYGYSNWYDWCLANWGTKW